MPWEETWNEVKQGVDEAVQSASKTVQNALPWLNDWGVKPTPQQPTQTPQKPSDEGDGFWNNFKQEWSKNSERRQKEISAIKQQEFGSDLPKAIQDLEQALSVKGLEGTTRSILRREYKDLTGQEYGVKGWKPWEPKAGGR